MSFESQQRMTLEWESISCPFCRALFKVSKQDLLPVDHYSFSCLSCSKIFWAVLNDHQTIEVLTTKPDVQDEEKWVNEHKICPHCYTSTKKGSVDCAHCGEAFYNDKWKKQAPPSSFLLRKTFEELLTEYDSTQKHEEFAALCISKNNIGFGSYCYSQLMKARPEDPIATKMFKYFEVILLTMTQKPPQTETKYWSYTMGWVHALLFFLFIALCFGLALPYFIALSN